MTTGASDDTGEVAGDRDGVIVVDDPADPRVGDYVALADPAERRRREREELFIAEGPAALAKLVASGHEIRSVLTTARHLARVQRIVGGSEAPVIVVSPATMAATVGFNLHRGIVASAHRRPGPTVTELVERLCGGPDPATRIAVLEGLNDPENVGLIARSARAFGIAGLVLDPTCIDPYYRRTVRVSMGEVLLLPVARSASWPTDLDRLRAVGYALWALTPDPAAASLWDLAPPGPVALLLGAEGPGLSAPALARADRRVRIPIDPAVDSLNVGHAAAVAFAALTRPGTPAGSA